MARTAQKRPEDDVNVEAQVKEAAKRFENEELIEIELTPDPTDDRAVVFISINGTSLHIPRGERVKVPAPFIDVLRQSKKPFVTY